MPENTSATAFEPLTAKQESTIYQPNQDWSDDFALKVVVQDFNAAEVFRTSQHDWRWKTHNELYLSWVEQKVWEGTRTPRSSLPIYLCFEQIESMLPKVLSQIFSDNPWFHVEPGPQTKAEEARQARDFLLMQMDQTKVREVLRRWVKSGLAHGNGIMQLSWIHKATQRKKYVPRWQPEFRMMVNPFTGQPVQVPAGMKRVLEFQEYTDIENRPELKFVQLSDFYIDPNCPSPDPSDARFCITRHLLDVDEVDALRKNEEFKIPAKEVLHEMAKHKTATMGDLTKGSAETSRQGFWNAISDQTLDPGGKRIECLCYWTQDRCVYVLDRRWVAYNSTNAYGFMPFYDFAYADVLGRFYALGMCDVLEGEQRFRTSLRNARVDEIALNIHRPIVKRIGVQMHNSQLRAKPGHVMEVGDPQKDLLFPDPPNILSAAYLEEQFADAQGQKVTGLSDLIASGMPQQGGNSASRTATGIGAQVQFASSRIQYLIENAEDMGIEPMLRDAWRLNQLYPPVGSESPVSPEVVVNSNLKFKMRASAKMQSRMSLLQTLPLFMQTFMNPALMQELGAQGQTLNMNELLNMVLDATGYKAHADLIRPLSQQEMQMRQQPPPQEMLRMQMQRERIQGQERIADKKLAAQSESEGARSEIDLAKAIIPAALKVSTDEGKNAPA